MPSIHLLKQNTIHGKIISTKDNVMKATTTMTAMIHGGNLSPTGAIKQLVNATYLYMVRI